MGLLLKGMYRDVGLTDCVPGWATPLVTSLTDLANASGHRCAVIKDVQGLVLVESAGSEGARLALLMLAVCCASDMACGFYDGPASQKAAGVLVGLEDCINIPEQKVYGFLGFPSKRFCNMLGP